MFTLLQAHEFKTKTHLLEASFKLRKQVFADQLGWSVPVHGDMEFDEYDDDNAHYLLWTSPDQKHLYGVVRLIATTKPTLLFDVFGDTHGNDASLISDDILEGTRLCVDQALIERHFPHMTAGQGFELLLLGVCEVALALGARRMVSNYEPVLARVYKRAGLDLQRHGMADGYGKRPVCCASFEVSRAVLARMRSTLRVDLPLFQPARGFVPLTVAPAPLAAAL